MTTWRRNSIKRDHIIRFGEESGLPLFSAQGEKRGSVDVASLPAAIPLATDTRSLSHTIVTHGQVSLGEKQQKVLDTIGLRDDWTYQELAEYLRWQVNRVTGRVMELRELGLVAMGPKRTCLVTGSVVMSWRVK